MLITKLRHFQLPTLLASYRLYCLVTEFIGKKQMTVRGLVLTVIHIFLRRSAIFFRFRKVFSHS